MYRLFKKRVTKPFWWLKFSYLQFGPQIRTEDLNSSSRQIQKVAFDAVLSGIPSPFSTLAKSSAARGQLDFFLEINLYNILKCCFEPVQVYVNLRAV